MTIHSTLLVTAQDVRRIVSEIGVDVLMDEMMDELAGEMRRQPLAGAVVPARTGFHYESPEKGLLEWMPAYDGKGKVTIKVVGYHPHNPSSNSAPTILSTVSRYDATSGHLLAIADATFLTALRTGAMSGLATRVLARDDSSVVGLIGLGAQAVTQLHAIMRCFEVRTVLASDVSADRIATFAKRISMLSGHFPEIRPASGEDVVGDSDILCTSTSVEVGKGPVFEDVGHKPWLHVNAVGSDFPGKFELPLGLLRRSHVVADFLPQARTEGECQHLGPDQVAVELSQLLSHPDKAAGLRDKTTVFDSTGWALSDQVALDLLLRHADHLGAFQQVQLESIDGDPFAPYPIGDSREAGGVLV